MKNESEVEVTEPETPDTTPSEPVTQNTKPSVEYTGTKATIEQTVLVDEADVKITANSLEYDDIVGPYLKLLIENNSDLDLTVQTNYVAVNACMVEHSMYIDVPAGKKANADLYFDRYDMAASGITDIADIEVSFHLTEQDKWEEYLDTDFIRIETSLADEFEYTIDESGDVIYDANGIKLIHKGWSTDEEGWWPGAIILAENNTDQNVTISTRNVSINGYVVDPLYYEDVCANKRSVDAVSIFQSDLAENGIESVEVLELTFEILDLATYDLVAVTDPFTITYTETIPVDDSEALELSDLEDAAE